MPQKNLQRLLNLSYTRLTNRGHCSDGLNLPETICNIDVPPDYLALYDERGYYHKTPNTCVCFYRYDTAFDGMHGLYNAIYFDDEKLLTTYRERFEGVNRFIAPDYSQCGDVHWIENQYRLFKARVVSLWLTLDLGASVMPNLTYSREEDIDSALEGLEKSSVLALSVKGALADPEEARLLALAVDRAIERMPLKQLVVYSSSPDDEKILALLEGAAESGVDIVIPDNALRSYKRRTRLGGRRCDGEV